MFCRISRGREKKFVELFAEGLIGSSGGSGSMSLVLKEEGARREVDVPIVVSREVLLIPVKLLVRD